MEADAVGSLEELVAGLDRGLRPRYLFFWSHRPARAGQVDQSCLSQWWMAKFAVEGVVYPSAEHFMMAEKARLFDDGSTLARILAAGSPAEAKKLGRQVACFDEGVWAKTCFGIVVRGNRAKFGQNLELADYLRSTESRILVEASPHDRVWGIGLDEKHPDAERPRRWKGSNLLGFALMQVRRELNS